MEEGTGRLKKKVEEGEKGQDWPYTGYVSFSVLVFSFGTKVVMLILFGRWWMV